jgi:hypothetical protein
VFINGFRLPQVCNVSGNPDLLNYSAFDAKGAMVYDTCAGKIKRWSGSAWIAVADSGAGGGGGDYVDTIYRKAGQDSIFYTINGGTERAVKDSVGGGGIPIDSVAIRRYGNVQRQNLRTFNAGFGGLNVGSANTTTSNDSANYALGYRSLESATTGYRNLMIGSKTATGLTTGFNNIGIGSNGFGANNSTVTGSYNVAIGLNSMPNITSGTNNVAIGMGAPGVVASAGQNLTSGVRNILIGNGIAGRLTTGNDNVILGASGVNNVGVSTGSNNMLIGFNAGQAVGASSNNTYIGSTTGTRNSGGNNTMIGTASGSAFTGNTTNTIIGANSAPDANPQRSFTGTNNAIFGHSSFSYPNIARSLSMNRNTVLGAFSAGVVTDGFDNNTIIGFSAGTIVASDSMAGKNNILIGAYGKLPSLTSNNQISFYVQGSGTPYNALTRFTDGQWLFNQTTSAVTTATASAALEINGVTRGFLPPRTTTADRNAIATPAAGLSVYNSSLATNDVYTNAWYQQPNGLTGSGTLDFPSTGAHSSSDLTITVTGAAVGDIVILGTPVQDVDGTFTAFVSVANTVTVRFNHYGSGTSDPASGTFKLYVIKN